MEVRAAEESELDQLTNVWHDAWRDSHPHLLPPELVRVRTRESFRARLQAALSNVRVVGPPGKPLGFSMTKGNELYQLFVASEARSSGVAAALLAEAENRLSASGVETAWLSCAIGNERAARFYEKCGWRRVGNMMNRVEIPGGEFPLEVWRYEKPLNRPA